MNKMARMMMLCAAALALAAAVSGCRSVPVTGRNQLLLTTESYENEMGVSAYAEYKSQLKTSTNATYNQALDRCGKAIAKVSGRNDFKWEFVVLESKEQNAFCLPGGKVAVYTGLLDIMNNEAELACVVAHEIGHAIARHGGERISWGYLQKLGAIGVALGFNNETFDNIYGTGSQLGVMLPFSRSNETEADLIGLYLMSRAGYDPQAAVQFWSRFSEGKEGNWISALTSTHPCDADRIKNFKENMPKAEAEYRKCAEKRGYGVTFKHK